MCEGIEVEVWIDGMQGCLVACVRTEPSTEKGVQTHQTQPHVEPNYRMNRTHRTQSLHYESQDAESTLRESGRNTTASDAGWLFADACRQPSDQHPCVHLPTPRV